MRSGYHLLFTYEELQLKEKVVQGHRSRNQQSWDLTQNFGFQVQDIKIASNNHSILDLQWYFKSVVKGTAASDTLGQLVENEDSWHYPRPT